jgi:hypothetical protein
VTSGAAQRVLMQHAFEQFSPGPTIEHRHGVAGVWRWRLLARIGGRAQARVGGQGGQCESLRLGY